MANSYDLQEWRNERGKLLKAQEDLLAGARSENRLPTPEENQKYDELETKYNDLGEAIQRFEKVAAERSKLMDENDAVQRNEKPENAEERTNRVFRNYLMYGLEGVDSKDRTVLKRGTDPQSTTTAGLGGYIVPETWYSELIKYMGYYGPMLEVCKMVRTNNGNQINIPYVDETAVVGNLRAENAETTVQDITFAEKVLNAYEYDSGLVKVPIALLEDSNYNLNIEIPALLGERLGRKLNADLSTANGSSKPNGVANASSAGKTAAATNAITRAELVDLVHSIDRAYRVGPKVAWMMHDSTIAAIKKLQLGSSDASPLWQPSITQGTPGTLEGYPVFANNNLAELTSGVSSKVVFFGDWDKYWVRIVNDVTLLRLVERFAEFRQVGMMSFLRADGELVDTRAIKHLALAAS